MEIKKITDAFVNEFDGAAQSCWDDCTEYRGKTSYTYNLIRRAGFGNLDWDHFADIKAIFGDFCYMEKTPKTCIYW